MPELPEVETVRRGLNQLTLSQPIGGGEVLLTRTLAHPSIVEDFYLGIKGTMFAVWQRRGKYLLTELLDHNEPVGWIGIHLRMTGQLIWTDRSVPPEKHTRIRLFIGENKELRFNDTRTFGKFWWGNTSQKPEVIITGLQKLGPEPLSPEFSTNYLADKLKNSGRNIKTVLLDQTVVAGIGNIYADEVLFVSRIKPDVRAASLDLQQIECLRVAITEVLQTAIEAGGTTFRDFLNVHGVNGNYKGMAWVYGRGGESCRVCGMSIAKTKIAGRSTHFCPSCQHT